MKTLLYIFSFVFLASQPLKAQSDSGFVIGVIKEVKPHFGGQQTLVVDNTELVLISDPKDASGNTFEINKPFHDLLLKKENTFILNPKYKDKTIKFSYRLNGKGWKCITGATEVHPKKHKAATIK